MKVVLAELRDLRITPQAISVVVVHIISETLILCAYISQRVDSLAGEENLLKIIKWRKKNRSWALLSIK